MKKMSLLYKRAPFLLVLLLAFACKKDELRSKELLVFLQADKAGIPIKTITAPFIHNPVSITGNRMIDVPAYATREVPADIDVTISPNPGLIATYNQQFGTSCVELPETAYRIVNGFSHTIAEGSLKSDPLQVEITHPELLTATGGYLLPFTITGIESKDKGAIISTSHATVYVKVTYEYNNILQTQVPLPGTLMSRTGWIVTVSNTTSGAPGTAMLDGNNATSWRSSNSSSAAKYVILNLGDVKTVSGFQLVPNYVSANENATRLTISTSTDSLTWNTQGVWIGTGYATGSTATAPDIKGINFAAPVSAKFFRFDINAWVSGSRVGIGEVNAVQ